jgi:hypothetical protein
MFNRKKVILIRKLVAKGGRVILPYEKSENVYHLWIFLTSQVMGENIDMIEMYEKDKNYS